MTVLTPTIKLVRKDQVVMVNVPTASRRTTLQQIMAQVRTELPDAVCSLLQCAPGTLDKELRLAAAIQWYQQGRISQEWAARIAGMDRTDFMLTLSHMGKESFRVDFEDLDRELARG